MARPLRLEYLGAFYHVTCRGNRREQIYRHRSDRLAWLAETDRVCRRYHFFVHAFCQMTNHFHMLVETPEGNLGQGMRQLNCAYSQYFNRRHDLVGHVMEGRYKAILVQRDTYVRELARYVVLNPVRAGIVARPEQWEWSSYRFMLGDPAPSWLTTEWLLACFGAEQSAARRAYQDFVAAGIGAASPLKNVRFQCMLGDELFVSQHRQPAGGMALNEVSREQRRVLVMPLAEYAVRYTPRDLAMAQAYRSTAYSMRQIAAHFGVSVKTVSRAVAAFEAHG